MQIRGNKVYFVGRYSSLSESDRARLAELAAGSPVISAEQDGLAEVYSKYLSGNRTAGR